jgi:hypothetical protein
MIKFLKAQVIWEYIIAVALGFILVIIFASYISSEIATNSEEREMVLLNDMARVIQKEIYLASEVETGYERYFEVPLDLEGNEYFVENSEKNLILRTGTYDIAITIPNARGSIIKGINRIRNINGLICFGNITCEDETPPSILLSSPSGTLAATQVTMSVTTDEPSTCAYSTEDKSYFSMRDSFQGTDIAHTASLTLPEGNYSYYARCKDVTGNAMTGSHTINFAISLS